MQAVFIVRQQQEIVALKAEVRTSEARVTKINDMRDKLAKKLATLMHF